MAYRHHPNHQPPTCPSSHQHLSPDPLLQSLFSLLLHHSHTPSPATFSDSACSTFDHRSSEQSNHKNQKEFLQPRQPSDHLPQTKCAAHSSLLQRIDLLESSFHRLASSPCSDSAFSLRDLAARRIQARFRSFLVSRSRGFRRLKELVSLKCSLDDLKSSIAPHKSLDSVSVSREANRLIRRLETVQAGDEVTRDGKNSILKDFVEFVEKVERICARKVEAPSMMLKNHYNLDTNENRLIDSLRERLGRMSEISEVVESEDECVGVEKLKMLLLNVEKRVRFLEDENATRACNEKKIEGAVEKLEKSTRTVDCNEDRDRDDPENEDKDESENEDSGDDDNFEIVNEGCGDDDEACEDEDESENGDSVDDEEAENENEVCEDEDETENEGSEGEYETENEGSEDEFELGSRLYEDVYETETDGSDEDDYDDDDETEEEGSEVKIRIIHNSVPKGNKAHGCSNAKNAQRFKDSENYTEETAAYASDWLKYIDMARDDRGSGNNHRRYLKNVICHNCFKRGHMKRDCWYNPTGRCSKCSEIGHTKEVCRSK